MHGERRFCQQLFYKTQRAASSSWTALQLRAIRLEIADFWRVFFAGKGSNSFLLALCFLSTIEKESRLGVLMLLFRRGHEQSFHTEYERPLRVCFLFSKKKRKVRFNEIISQESGLILFQACLLVLSRRSHWTTFQISA